MQKKHKWESYEDVARQLIDDIKEQLGLCRVNEGKFLFPKSDGGECEIDVSAYDISNEKLVLVECKRKKRRLSPEEIHGFAYRIQQTNAKRGIIVTTIGLQKGARIAADAAKITLIILNGESTIDEYIARITQKLFLKTTDHFNGISSTVIEAKSVNNLPVFEEAIRRLRKKYNRADISEAELAEEVKRIKSEI